MNAGKYIYLSFRFFPPLTYIDNYVRYLMA